MEHKSGDTEASKGGRGNVVFLLGYNQMSLTIFLAQSSTAYPNPEMVNTSVLKTVVCFVTYYCVYVVNLPPGTKPECE